MKVKPRNQKYFPSRPTQISSLIRAVSSHQRGRSRVVTSAGRDAVDAAALGAQIAGRTNDAEAYGQVVSF
jgi:hypothetical protein